MENQPTKTCDNCNGSNCFIENTGYIVCKNCGVTNGRIFSDSSYEYHPLKERGGTQGIGPGKRLYRTDSLGSEIGVFRSNFKTQNKGKKVTPGVNKKYFHLSKKYHIPAKNISDQTHLRTFIIFEKVCSKLELSDSIKERTGYLYWKLEKKHKVKITNHVLLIALCLLYAIRESGGKTPIKFQEIIKGFQEMGHRVTNKNIFQLAHKLDIKLNKTPIRRSEDYLERITSIIKRDDDLKTKFKQKRFDFPIETYQMLLINIGREILNKIPLNERGGVQPFAFAVSVIYMADRIVCRFYKKSPLLTQKITAKVTGAKEFTIRDHCYRILGGRVKKIKLELVDYILRNYGLGEI